LSSGQKERSCQLEIRTIDDICHITEAVMTAPDTLDLFSPALRRERMVDTQAPGPAAKAAMGLSGMEAMQAIRDGRLPPPPLAKLIGFRGDLAVHATATFSMISTT
jgi:hypothetical protein